MLKRIGALTLAAMFSATVFGGCGAGAEGTLEPVETVISEFGVRETDFDPPEEIITMNEQGEPQTWIYQHMITTPARGFSVDIGGADVEEVSYYYQDNSGYQIRIDENGRIRSYTSNFDSNNPQWISNSLVQEDIVEVVKAASMALDVDIDDYPDIVYMPEPELTMIYFYRDQSSPYTDWVSAQFNSQGILEGIVYYYSGIEELSYADEEYFQNIIDDYLLNNKDSLSCTVKTTYRVRDNTLLAFYNVTFSDSEQGTWVENYVAGLPVEH